jgi:hypothetical protein
MKKDLLGTLSIRTGGGTKDHPARDIFAGAKRRDRAEPRRAKAASSKKRRARASAPGGNGTNGDGALAGLKRTDRRVFESLLKLTRGRRDKTCVVDRTEMSGLADVSERAVWNSYERLIEAGLIERLGYDYSNPDVTKRGTKIKVLYRPS